MRRHILRGERDIETQTHPKIPCIDLQRIRHDARNSHELAQGQQRLLCPRLRDDELHRRRVHPDPQWGDHAEVRRRRQGVELVFADRLVAESEDTGKSGSDHQGLRDNGEEDIRDAPMMHWSKLQPRLKRHHHIRNHQR